MKFFVDTANVEDIKKANDMGSSVELQQTLHSSQKRAEISMR